MRPGVLLSLVCLGLVFTPGCGTFRRVFGIQEDLKGRPLQRLDAELHGGNALCPGASAPLVVTATLENGKRLVSEGVGGGKVPWENFRLQPVGAATVTPTGEVRLETDPRKLLAGPLAVRVEVASAPGTAVEVPLSARFDCAFVADFSGKPGHAGAAGKNGQRGRDGTETMDASNRGIPGGPGENAGSGNDGANGQDGENVDVEVTRVDDGAHPLLQVIVKGLNRGRVEHFRVDPQGGTLTIRTNGGKGGAGGPGGAGGDGGRGGTGYLPGNGGQGGGGGYGGHGGNGGRGGHILVRLTPEASPYKDVLRFENQGAPGGEPGPGGHGGMGGRAGDRIMQTRATMAAGYDPRYMAQRGRDGMQGNDGHPGSAGPVGPVPEFRTEPAQVSGTAPTQ